jgi:DNA polymerase-1
LYEGAKDFHERTASFIFKTITPDTRDAIKFLSYIYIYGGSESTLVDKTGWTLEQVQKVLGLLDKKIAPIKEFREKLFMEAQENSAIEVPGGRVVYVDDEDLNPGKAIGLYAQSYSSWVFEQAFVRVQRMLREMKSKAIFEVHDELVIDVHPDDFGRMEDVRVAMEYNGHAVKMKKGPSYGQQSN